MAELTAPVEVVEPTGAETMAILRIGEKEITGRFDPNDRPQPGERMILNVDMTRACLFDPATDRLIPRVA
jgi:multiple sugar transport system ATP-binding protein